MSLKVPSALVETDWLAEHLDDPNLRIIDCSVAGVRNEDGSLTFVSQRDAWQKEHIPGSNHIDIAAELSDPNQQLPFMLPDADQFARAMLKTGIDNSSCVVLCDRSNHAWATRVWWMLRTYGFDNAAVLNGGFSKWKAEGRPVKDGPERHGPAQKLTLTLRPYLFADKAEVFAAIADDVTTLLNSLPRPIFTGEVAPYGRAGRIPGSKHLSCEAIVDPEAFTYLSLDVIRRMVQDSDIPYDRRVITYCGGGIAASSTAFVLTLLGYEDVAIYDGSLSEWCADTSLPLETGEPD